MIFDNLDLESDAFDDDEESEEVKELKNNLTLALVSITQATKDAQVNLDAGLYTKFLKNIEYISGMVQGLVGLHQILTLTLNASVEDLEANGIDMSQVNEQIKQIMAYIVPTEVAREDQIVKQINPDSVKKQETKDDDLLDW